MAEKRKWTRLPAVQIGDQYGLLTVVECGSRNSMGPTWWCVCECDRLRILDKPVNDGNIKRGTSKSCGCVGRKKASQLNLKHGDSHCKEGCTRTYACWQNMKSRCYNEKNNQYENYGGRVPPITVCDRWKDDYVAFKEDMGECPDGMTIERKDNDLGYSPDNCVWATRADQNRNKRNTVRYTYKGQTKLVRDWAEEYGISADALYHRLKLKPESDENFEEAVSTPVSERHYTWEYKGQTYTLEQLSDMTGMPKYVLTARLNRWKSIERAIETPYKPLK